MCIRDRFNRKYVLARIAAAKEQGIPMTNYGMLLAYLQGILPQVIWQGKNDASIANP